MIATPSQGDVQGLRSDWASVCWIWDQTQVCGLLRLVSVKKKKGFVLKYSVETKELHK